ncbi:MAG: PrsW family intramembrane metalloprotease [Phaeodactylibacter sp.]|nr:PrsW family intramembrane metalloprotease [Phaeodactylibacter sp.]
MDVAILLLNFLGLFFLGRYVIQLVKEYRATEEERPFFTFRRFRHIISLALVVGIPLLLANFIFPLFPGERPYHGYWNEDAIWWISAGMAFLISGVWLAYLRRLDIFEPEKWIFPPIAFMLSYLCAGPLCRLMYGYLEASGLDFFSYDSWVGQFLYCVFIIGGIEELCKALPVLFILVVFKRAINEPYDYILYGSVSALGFAFVENIGYIFFSRFASVGARAFYAAVAHMAFTSIFCYGLMLWRFQLTRLKGIVIIPLSFFLAMAAHGFYDFWLISEWEEQYSAVTTVFFLITVHLWVTMKNNAINVSNYFSPGLTIDNDRLRYFLIVSLTGLFMLSYLVVAVVHGTDSANQYLFLGTLSFGYLIFYLAFGLSRYRIVKEKMNPLQVPFDFFVPKPAVTRQEAGPNQEDRG